MAIAVETWKGSVCVVVTVGINPIRWVTGAIRAAMRCASSRARTRSAPCPGTRRLSSIVRKSSRPRSASAARAVQYPADVSSAGRAPGSRHAAGCQPAPSSATPRCTRPAVSVGGAAGVSFCAMGSPSLLGSGTTVAPDRARRQRFGSCRSRGNVHGRQGFALGVETTQERPATAIAFPRDARREVLVCCLAGFATLLDSGAVAIALPTLRAELGASPGQTQWILASYSLAFGLALVPAGRLGDVQGRRRLFLAGVAVFSSAAFVSSLADGAWQVVVARLAQGAAAGVISSQVLGIIADRFTGVHRARALAAYGVAIGLAGVAGPVAAGTVLAVAGEQAGWRWTLALNVPFGAVALVGGALFLRRDGAPRAAARFDIGGLGLLAAATLLVLIPLVARPGATGAALCVLGAGAALALLLRWERRYARGGGTPVLVPELLAARGFTLGAAVATFYFGAALAVNTVLTLYLIERRGLGALEAALLLVGGGLAMAVSSGTGWRVAARFGRATVVWALVAEATVVALYLAAVRFLPDPALLVAVAVLATASGVASGLVDAPNRALTLEYAPAEANGVAAGLLQLVQRLSATVALTAATGLYLADPHTSRGPALALTLCLAMFLAGAGFAVADARRRASTAGAADPPGARRTAGH